MAGLIASRVLIDPPSTISRGRDDDHGDRGIMLSANLLGKFFILSWANTGSGSCCLHRGPVVEAIYHGLKTCSAEHILSGRDQWL